MAILVHRAIAVSLRIRRRDGAAHSNPTVRATGLPQQPQPYAGAPQIPAQRQYAPATTVRSAYDTIRHRIHSPPRRNSMGRLCPGNQLRRFTGGNVTAHTIDCDGRDLGSCLALPAGI